MIRERFDHKDFSGKERFPYRSLFSPPKSYLLDPGFLISLDILHQTRAVDAGAILNKLHNDPTTYKAKAYSAASETAPMASTTIARRDPTERDVQIEILFCGICHSDLHSVRNEWSEFMATNYPIVPGHEIVGRVIRPVGRYQIQARRSRRGRLQGRLRPDLPKLQT